MPDAESPSAATSRRRRLPGISLRIRLTAWVLAIFAVIQITLGGIVFLYQRASIDSFFEERLAIGARRIRAALAETPGPPSDADLIRQAAEQLQFFMFERFYLVVFDAQGAVVASSSRPPPTIPSAAVSRALTHTDMVIVPDAIRGQDDAEPRSGVLRAAIGPYTGPRGSRYILLVASGDEYAQGMLSRVTQALLTTAPVGLLAAGVAGWCIAGIAVAPLRELRGLARRFSPESIGEPMLSKARDPEFARLERDLEGARERIAQALASQERFISNVSHEFKTPISVVLMESQALELDNAPEPIRKYVGSVREEMQRLGRLINSFLTLTRVREGRSQTVSRPCMINELLLESLGHCRPMARQHNVALRAGLLDDVEDVDLTIRGDPELLRTMLDNLVRNAIRFSPAGGEVQVRGERDNGSVCIHVRDFGAGIPENMLHRIFDRFAQATAEERRGRGHGLGLEIAQGVAELHGGKITVENCPDRGCEFTVRLPIKPHNFRA